MKSKRLVLNVIVLLFIIIIFLLLFEGLLRIFIPQSLNYMKFNETTEYIPRVNFETYVKTEEFIHSIKINSFGFRGEEFSKDKNDSFRIVVLGDSFAFGWGVEEDESFSEILESSLKEMCKKIEVINLGVPGYSTVQEVELLKNFALGLKPDFIILAFFEGNDFSNNYYSALWEGNAILYKTKKLESPNLNFKMRSYLSSHLHMYILTKRAVDTIFKKNEERRALIRAAKVPKYYSNFSESDINLHTSQILFEFRRTTSDIPYVILVVPPYEKVSDKAWNDFVRDTNLDLSDSGRVNTNILFNSNDMLNLYDPIINSGVLVEDLYWIEDQHFTQKGHILTANVLKEHILKNDVLMC